jgi:lipopolysaccharide/colanic/teichoic acid biosynthesis glycosyltransferase
MIPLQFVRWNPELASRAVAGGMPLYLRLFKRLVDLLGAGVLALLVLPFLPIVAWAIKRDSAGPILYSQTRLGEGGQHFRIYKFRSMYTDAEAARAQSASLNDSRVTPFGNVIRKTRIDELPQIWNVLKGDMSIVGPRPERPEHMENIETAIPEFSLRTTVKPGLTGWAQTSYQYAGTVDELRTKLEYDLYYIQFASIWMELLILLRTMKVALGNRG